MTSLQTDELFPKPNASYGHGSCYYPIPSFVIVCSIGFGYPSSIMSLYAP